MTVVALEQIDAKPGQADRNTAEMVERSERAFRRGANIIVFPELANSGYIVAKHLVAKTAQRVDDQLVNTLMRIAARHSGLVTTGFCEIDGDEYYNSVVIVGSDGPILHYRKLHLFAAEKDVFTAGETLPVVDTEFGVLGVCVCYDLRFVEVLRLLSLRGADIVLAPAAWVGGFDPETSADRFTKQAEAAIVQANLNQVAIVAVSQVSSMDRQGVRTLGGSLAIDALGSVICGPLSRHLPASAQVTIDISAGRAAQQRGSRIHPRLDRRSDVYGIQYGEELF